MDAQLALQRLRDPDHPAVPSLATLLVEDALDTPISELVDPEWLAAQITAGVEALTRTDRVVELAQAAVDEALSRWGDSTETLREHLPEPVIEPLRAALAHPYVPTEALVWRLLDQPMFRSLMAEVLENSIQGFRSRMSGVDDKLLGGLGRRAAKRGRGLFGGVADSVVGAVAGEVEHQFDRRLKEFLGKATGEALRVVARHVANPDNAESYAEVRVAITESVLDTPISELAGEIAGARPIAYVEVVLEGLRSAVADPAFVQDSTRRLRGLMDEVGDGTFGAWLADVGLRDVWTQSTVSLMTQRLRKTATTDAFEAWWVLLHTPA